MIRKSSKLVQHWVLFQGLSLVVPLAWFSTIPSQAAENISAYVDSGGRVTFVNDGSEPRASSKAPTAGDTANGRRVIVSTEAGGGDPGASEEAAQPTESEAVPVEDAGYAEKSRVETLIEQAALQHQIDADLIRAIIQVESNFNPYAVSPAGARGLMQLVPATARRFGVSNAFDPRANLDGGIRYLKYLLDMYRGDLRLSLAAYNAGEEAVARSRGIPAFRETQNYIRKIGELYPLRVVPAGAPEAPRIMKFVDAAGVIHFSNTDLP